MSAVAGLLAAALAAAPPANVDPRASAEWWIETYGQASRGANAAIGRAERLLERLWSAAGQRLALPPRLVVLANDRPGLLALALPDNSILMSRAGLDFCLGAGASPAADGDARLGLVLAHELDHILRVDDWHVAAFASDAQARRELRSLTGSRDVRFAAELRADANAVLLLAAAGIDPAGVLRPTSFLDEWARARAGDVEDGATHPAAQRRVGLMRRELERLLEHLPLFREGVAALEAGRPEAALQAFDRFHRRTRYAGKELLNNVGLAHYQLGAGALARCDAAAVLRFRLGTHVEGTLDFTRRHVRGPGAERCLRQPGVTRTLDTAVTRLQEAVAADPSYLPARLNLIAAQVLAGRVSQAYSQARELAEDASLRAAVEALPAGDARRVAIRNAQGVCSYLMRREVDAPADEALAELRALAREHDRAPEPLFNLARVLQETGRSAEARDAWARYLRLVPGEPYATAARDALEALGAPGVRDGGRRSPSRSPRGEGQ